MKISKTMRETLLRILPKGEIRPLPGGFWVVAGNGWDARGVPDWYCATGTVYALAARGLLEKLGAGPAHFSVYVLTELGLRTARELEGASKTPRESV